MTCLLINYKGLESPEILKETRHGLRAKSLSIEVEVLTALTATEMRFLC